MNSFHFIKYYFDLITNDKQKVLFIYFIITKIFGKKIGIVEVHFWNNNGQIQNYSKIFSNNIFIDKEKIVIGMNYLITNDQNKFMNINLNDIFINLKYKNTGRAWLPTNNGTMIKNKKRFLSWIVPNPVSGVCGHLSQNGNTGQVKGRGYQDIIEMTIAPWNLHINELYWGRAHCGPYTVVFDKFKILNGKLQKFLIIQKYDEKIIETSDFNIEFDPVNKSTKVFNECFCLTLNHKSIIENTPVSSKNRISSSILRKIISSILGNPKEIKYFSEADLYIRSTKITGMAINEIVTWKRRVN